MTSPMQRTLKVIKKDNLKYWIVEYWKPWAKKRVDLFNIIDILVLDNGVVGIQVCGKDFKSHKTKIMVEERDNSIAWLSQPGTRLEVWGWRKLKKTRGGKATHWLPRIAEVTLPYYEELEWKELNNGEIYQYISRS